MNTVLSALHARVIQPIRSRLRLTLEDGLEAVEYALIAALLSVVIIGAMAIFNEGLTDAFESIRDTLQDPAADLPAPAEG
jgi:Flp pilus assembly pilin Flp